MHSVTCLPLVAVELLVVAECGREMAVCFVGRGMVLCLVRACAVVSNALSPFCILSRLFPVSLIWKCARVYQVTMTATSADQLFPPPTPMQRLPLLDFPIDILFLILYELSVEDLLSFTSVSSIIAITQRLC